ncbi:unnamed protein product [Rhizopus stolonifer]
MKEIGSYHYVSGVDASSSATLAAYLNSLTYSLDDTQSWFSKSNAWRIRLEFIVALMPFHEWMFESKGERHEASPAIWQEAYLSGVLRAILYSDDSYYRLAGYRKIDPITNLAAEGRFLEAVEALFWKGWQLGSNPEIQTATSVQNHLTSGVMKYFGDSFRYGPAIKLYEKLRKKDPEAGALLAQSFIGQNEEMRAIQVLNHELKKLPISYALLHVQVDFLRSKREYQMALKLAKFAVNTTPSEFLTWAKLTEVYIDIKDYKNALLTLNSCPMFTYSERDMHRMPAPVKTHLPIKVDILNSGIMEEDAAGRENEVDPNLSRLPAPALHGTFAKAYSLLTRLASKIGWDDLLRYRSQVFVMEEEYRVQKAKEDVQRSSSSVHDDIKKPVRNSSETVAATINAEALGEKSEEKETEENIDVTTEETVDVETATINAETTTTNAETTTINAETLENKTEDELAENMETVDLNADDKESTPIQVHHTPLLRPDQVAEEEKSGLGDTDDDSFESTPHPNDGVNFTFSNKRLCERWLDNLFMVLYEDLRIYTFWKTEAAHYRAQLMPYRKTGAEWELLGDLALRLWHEEDAKEAYQQCLDHKFSAKSWMKLLEIYVSESNVQRALLAAVKLTVYHERWYHEIVYPSEIARSLNVLVRREGLSKMQNILTSMNLPRSVQLLMARYFNYAELFKVEGSEF